MSNIFKDIKDAFKNKYKHETLTKIRVVCAKIAIITLFLLSIGFGIFKVISESR